VLLDANALAVSVNASVLRRNVVALRAPVRKLLLLVVLARVVRTVCVKVVANVALVIPVFVVTKRSFSQFSLFRPVFPRSEIEKSTGFVSRTRSIHDTPYLPAILIMILGDENRYL
jgi:hypothetical protein